MSAGVSRSGLAVKTHSPVSWWPMLPSVTFLLRVTHPHTSVFSSLLLLWRRSRMDIRLSLSTATLQLSFCSVAPLPLLGQQLAQRSSGSRNFSSFSAAATSRARQSPRRRAFSIVMNVSAMTITNTSRCGTGTGSTVTRQYHQNIPPALFCSPSFLFFPPSLTPWRAFFFFSCHSF